MIESKTEMCLFLNNLLPLFGHEIFTNKYTYVPNQV